MRWVIKGDTPAHAVFKGHHSAMYRLIASCANFGSSAADTATGGGVITGTTLYYHPQLGNDSNSGLTALLPKQNLPLTLSGSTKYLIASGSTITLSQTVSGIYNLFSDNIVVSVYESNTRSSSFGQEITNFENPFNRALLGNWVNESERQAKYYTIDGVDIYNINNNRAFNVDHASIVINACIRGAWIKNTRRAGIVAKRANCRIEDCVFEDVQNGLVLDEVYGGVAVRAENLLCNMSIARCWFSGAGEDTMWLYEANTNYIADCAIIHNSEKQMYASQHCDVIQWSANVADFTVRRVVASHKSKDTTLIPNLSETLSLGSFLMDTGGSPTRTSGLMEDVVYMTNRQGTNFELRGGVTKNRCIEYELVNSRPAGNAGFCSWWQTGNNVNNGVMCQQSPMSSSLNGTPSGGAFSETGMRYYNLNSSE
jgi:hypothetical protein